MPDAGRGEDCAPTRASEELRGCPAGDHERDALEAELLHLGPERRGRVPTSGTVASGRAEDRQHPSGVYDGPRPQESGRETGSQVSLLPSDVRIGGARRQNRPRPETAWEGGRATNSSWTAMVGASAERGGPPSARKRRAIMKRKRGHVRGGPRGDRPRVRQRFERSTRSAVSAGCASRPSASAPSPSSTRAGRAKANGSLPGSAPARGPCRPSSSVRRRRARPARSWTRSRASVAWRPATAAIRAAARTEQDAAFDSSGSALSADRLQPRLRRTARARRRTSLERSPPTAAYTWSRPTFRARTRDTPGVRPSPTSRIRPATCPAFPGLRLPRLEVPTGVDATVPGGGGRREARGGGSIARRGRRRSSASPTTRSTAITRFRSCRGGVAGAGTFRPPFMAATAISRGSPRRS